MSSMCLREESRGGFPHRAVGVGAGGKKKGTERRGRIKVKTWNSARIPKGKRPSEEPKAFEGARWAGWGEGGSRGDRTGGTNSPTTGVKRKGTVQLSTDKV